MPNRIPDSRAGGPEGNRLPGEVSTNRLSAEKAGAANAPATTLRAHVAPARPTVELLVDGGQTDGDYAVLDIRLPRGLTIPRHVWGDHSAVARVLDGALEVHEDDRPSAVVRKGAITVAHGRPIAAHVLVAAHLVVILAPATAAELLVTAAAPDLLPDDRAALLAAAGITTLPTLRVGA
jgi:quercetin dioxygenase-like cupin family protein